MIKMSTVSEDIASSSRVGPSTTTRIRNAFARGFAAMQAAQEAKAKVMVAPYLARMTDKELTDLGFGPAEIQAIRRRAASRA